MDTRLLKSIFTVAIVISLGIGVTYAQLQSNTVTISGNTIGVPDAKIKLCNNVSGDRAWRTSLNGFSVAGLVPGGSAELTAGAELWVGNDNGLLAANAPAKTPADPNRCGTYAETAEDSGTALNLVPQVSNFATCDDLSTDVELRFTFNGTPATGWHSLTAWSTNATPLAPTLQPGALERLVVEARIAAGADDPAASCTFDIQLHGEQA